MRLITIILKEWMLYWRDKKAALLLFLMPLFFIWLFAQALSPYLFSSRYSQTFAIAFVDEDQTLNTQMISQQLEELDYMKGFITVHRVDRKRAMDMLAQNQIAGCIIIPKGFTASLYSGDNFPVTFIGNRSQKVQADQAKNQLISATNDLSAGQSGVKAVWYAARDGGATPQQLDRILKESVFDFMTRALGRNEIYDEVTLATIPDVSFPEYFTAALTIVFVSFLGVRGSRLLAEEKELGVLDRFRTLPGGVLSLYVGKFIAMFLLLLLQTALIVGMASLMFKNYLGAAPLSFILVFFGTAFSVATWSFLLAVIGLFSRGAELLGYVGTFFLALIGGNIYPLFSLSESLQTASDFTFNKWAMHGMLKVFSGNHSLSVWPETMMLLAIGGALLVAAVVLLPLTGRK
ncbi:ABC-2 family transporter protein [Aneurinibacillus thermoaerophilus]|uniref:ABC-2 family transporter protein n=1 Tax=Aneurinibacillus thermoaerophilus TaxID=143495 RepID=A0A1G8CAD4_ANETH|nr:ABC transporter permease [Aneurinibacillus thermoaerophilus]SDH42279.1 ABC-2 family transporter protein [Aneurinibacillus thermoaerophilus]